MKKLFLLISAACFIFPAGATLPDYLRRYADKDGDQMAVFTAMDRLEDENRDSMHKINYDAYPDGRRFLSRQIINQLNTHKTKRIYAVFDSIISRPNTQRFAFKNDNTVVCQFGATDMNNLVVDFTDSGFAAQKNASAITMKGNLLYVAQAWTINTPEPTTDGNFTAINNQFNKIADKAHSFVKDFNCSIQTSPGGVLRLRDNETDSDNKVTGKRVIYTKATTREWIHTYDLFMEHFGANENISLSYYRYKRTVTLIDYSSKTIYAAYFRPDIPNTDSNGTLTVLIATYSGPHPYLPENWATGNF